MSLKTELKALLLKYDAHISFECSEDSDTHGIRGAHIAICENRTDNKLLTSDMYSYTLHARDIQ